MMSGVSFPLRRGCGRPLRTDAVAPLIFASSISPPSCRIRRNADANETYADLAGVDSSVVAGVLVSSLWGDNGCDDGVGAMGGSGDSSIAGVPVSLSGDNGGCNGDGAVGGSGDSSIACVLVSLS